jgi:hypothetical protein
MLLATTRTIFLIIYVTSWQRWTSRDGQPSKVCTKVTSRLNKSRRDLMYMLMNIVTASLDQPQFSKLQPRLNLRWPTVLTDPGISIEEPPARLVARTRDSNDSTHAHDLPNNLATLESVPALKWQLVETIPSPMNILMSSSTCFKLGVSLRMEVACHLVRCSQTTFVSVRKDAICKTYDYIGDQDAVSWTSCISKYILMISSADISERRNTCGCVKLPLGSLAEFLSDESLTLGVGWMTRLESRKGDTYTLWLGIWVK